MKANGVPSASFDILNGTPTEGKQNAMDILSDAGFAFVVCIWCIMKGLKTSIMNWETLLHSTFLESAAQVSRHWPVIVLAHLRLILLAILNARFDDFFCVLGLVCSSWVTISQGTHYRAPWAPLGRDHIPFVDQGNRMTSRNLA